MIGLALLSLVLRQPARAEADRLASSATSRRIMAGDLSGRLEVTGTGDEFDRLADSLNAMLERIEQLLHGLKDVSDNIAHDLKTPLTRLRNRVESGAAGPADARPTAPRSRRRSRNPTSLIQTFNALLMIARIEAGSPDGAMTEVDAGAIVRDVAELYEPVAEEKGVELAVDAPEPVTLTASRELLGQALANLIDNAIKYAPPEGEGHEPSDRRFGRARRQRSRPQGRRQRPRHPRGRPRAGAPALRAAGKEPVAGRAAGSA